LLYSKRVITDATMKRVRSGWNITSDINKI
jgi:hypothetical protein